MKTRCRAYFIIFLFCLVVAKWITQRKSVVLVPALFRHTLEEREWMRGYPTAVYQKHNPEAPNYIPNKGYEAAFYFKYIVDNYDALPQTIR